MRPARERGRRAVAVGLAVAAGTVVARPRVAACRGAVADRCAPLLGVAAAFALRAAEREGATRRVVAGGTATCAVAAWSTGG